MSADSVRRLGRGVELFNRQEFFAAHDVWEEAWREETGDTRLMLQGLIQVAVGFVKLQRGRPGVAIDLLDKGAAKLAALPSGFAAVDLPALLESVAAWRVRAGRMAETGQTDFDPAALPRLALLTPPGD